jgi:hypothetical protein
MNSSQIVSKKRVADHGEVYTNLREINDMLDLVDHETKRIDARFLEPACGHGNFLIEVLKRKIEVIKNKFSKSQIDFDRNLFLAVATIYGIDIQKDNVIKCQERLLEYVIKSYKEVYKNEIKKELLEATKFVLSRNILCGDALTLKTFEEDLIGKPIIFSDWAIITGGLVKRKDFIFSDLIERSGHREMPLFSDLDDDDEAFIPEPIKDYPPIHFLEIKDGYSN